MKIFSEPDMNTDWNEKKSRFVSGYPGYEKLCLYPVFEVDLLLST